MDDHFQDLPEGRDKLLANLAWTQGLARSLVRGPEAAEELVQETWWRLLRNPPPTGSQERSWIAAVMRRTLGDGYRSARRRKHRETTFAQDRAEATDLRHDSELRLHRDLVEHVEELEPPLRRVVLLRYFDSLSLAEVAEREGLKVSGAKSRLERAHECLRHRLKKNPERPAGAWFLLQLPRSKAALPAAVLAPSTLLAMKTAITAALVAVLSLVGQRLMSPPESAPSLAMIQPAHSAAEPIAAGLEAPEPAQRTTLPSASPVVEVARVAPPEEPAAVEASTAFRIRVVDELGEPQEGVPVCFVGDATYQVTFWEGKTDSQGLASVPDEVIEQGRDSAHHTSFLTALNVPCGPEGAVWLDLDNLASEPVELVLLGPRGTLTVELKDQSGAPVTACRLMTLDDTRSKGGLQRATRRFESPVASVTFEELELNSRFLLLGVLSAPWGVINQEVSGPTAVGEHKVVEVNVTVSEPLIVGRFVNPDGTAFSVGKSVFDGSIRSLEGRARSGGMQIELGAGGKFRSGIIDGLDSVLEEMLKGEMDAGFSRGDACAIRISCRPEGKDLECFVAETEGVFPGPGERLDLGDVILRPAPVRLGGVVLQSGGEPVVGANVRMVPLDPELPLLPGLFFPARFTTSNEEGRFAFFDLPTESDFALQASHAGFASSRRVPVHEGELEVVLDLPSSRSLLGAIIPPEGLDPGMIRVKVIEDVKLPPQVGKTAKVAPDWTFRVDGLAHQPCTLQITNALGKSEFIEIKSLMPAMLEAQQDERLARIDLRGKVLPIHVEVLDQAGQPVEEGSATIAGEHFSFEGGHLDAVVPLVEGELIVGAPGQRYERFNIGSLPERVVLEPGIRVRLRAPSPWPSQVDRDLVRVTLRRAKAKGDGTTFPMGATARKTFGEQDSLEFVVPGPGAYSVSWSHVDRNEASITLLQIMRTAAKRRVDVMEDDGVQEFNLTP